MGTNRMGFIVVILLLVLIPAGSVFALTPYDDFSGAWINSAKWDDQEWVREIRNIGGNNKLVSRVTGYGTTNRNYLYVKNPAGIYYLEAIVTLTSATAPFNATQTTYLPCRPGRCFLQQRGRQPWKRQGGRHGPGSFGVVQGNPEGKMVDHQV